MTSGYDTSVPQSDAADEAPAALIAGRWEEGTEERLTSRNPATGDELLAFRAVAPAAVGRAVDAARDAAPSWRETPPLERQRLLNEVAARIENQQAWFSSSIVEEVGKPINEAREEVNRAAAILRYHAAAALDPHGATIPSAGGDGFVFTAREPLGHVGLILPWNFPMAIPLWKIAPALAYGNTLVVKPAPHATRLALAIAELFDGFPPGVLNVVAGGAETGLALARSPLKGLSFTGSTAVGMAVATRALGSGARYQAEMGGKNASVVLADADLELAAGTVVRAAMGFAGQKCTATSRVIVEEAVHDRFLDLLLERFACLRVGRPDCEATDMGPVIDAAAVGRISAFVERAVADGADVLFGGEPRSGLGDAYYAPTLLSGVGPEAEVSCTEIFGPVLVLASARDADEALRVANGTGFGLAAAVFTRDLNLGMRFAQRLDAGVVRVNGPTPGVEFNAPFGPRNASGLGLPEQGKAARDFFTSERTVTVVGT